MKTESQCKFVSTTGALELQIHILIVLGNKELPSGHKKGPLFTESYSYNDLQGHDLFLHQTPHSAWWKGKLRDFCSGLFQGKTKTQC